MDTLLFSHSVVSDSLQPHGLQHARLPRPSASRGTCSNSCPSSWWCQPTISSSVISFSSGVQSSPASGSFPMSQRLSSSGQSTGASASVLPVNIQDWFPLGLTALISLQLSESESRLVVSTLCDPMDCGDPMDCDPMNAPGKNTGVGSRSLLYLAV